MPALQKSTSHRTSAPSTVKKPGKRTKPEPAAQKRLDVRTTAQIREFIERAASVSGRSMTDLILAGAMKEAREAIENANLIRMSEEAQLCFAQAMLSPPRRNAALSRAYRHEKRLLRSDL